MYTFSAICSGVGLYLYVRGLPGTSFEDVGLTQGNKVTA